MNPRLPSALAVYLLGLVLAGLILAGLTLPLWWPL